MLIAMTAGFIAYGLWRLADAALNIETHDDDGKGMRQRVGAAGSGIIYLLLAWTGDPPAHRRRAARTRAATSASKVPRRCSICPAAASS